MENLPAELWLRVAHFIGYPDIVDYLTVHPVFLQYALDGKYSEAGFDQAKAEDMFRGVKRLKRPGVGPRVKVMKLRPYAIVQALNAQIIVKEPVTHTLPRSRTRSLIDSFIRREPATRTILPPEHIHIPASPEERLQELESAAALLTDVNELRIYWDSNFHLEGFFERQSATLFPRINPKLRTLVLDMPFWPSIKPILMPLTSLQLDSLTIHTKWATHTNTMPPEECATLVSFVNSFTSTLTKLTLVIGGHFDASQLFGRLGPFPSLRHLVLGTTFLRGHLTSPASVRGFLSRHRQLASLRLKGRCCCHGRRIETLPSYCYEECFDGLQLPELRELSLGLPIAQGLRDHLRERRFANMLLSSICTFITSFKLEETLLNTTEAVELLRLLPAGQLRSLSMHISSLRPSFLQFSATTCRELVHLKLYVDYFGTVDRNDDLPRFLEEIDTLAGHRIHEPYFRTWTLVDLEIVTWEYGKGRREGSEVMRAIAKYVPALKNNITL